MFRYNNTNRAIIYLSLSISIYLSLTLSLYLFIYLFIYISLTSSASVAVIAAALPMTTLPPVIGDSIGLVTSTVPLPDGHSTTEPFNSDRRPLT